MFLTDSANVTGIALNPAVASHPGVEIRKGEFNVPSDFETAAGRKHMSWEEYFRNLQKNACSISAYPNQ